MTSENKFSEILKEVGGRVQTRQEWITDILRNAILKGYYNDGRPIETTKIATELNVSRMPIRTALKQLESEGLVVLEPHKKATATNLSPIEVQNICEIRIELESLAIRRIIDNVQFKDIELLEEIVKKMDAVESAEDFISYNKKFHEELNKISRNEMLIDMISKLRNNVSRYLNVYVLSNSTYSKIRQGNEDHKKILKSIKDKDSKRAERLIREHLTKTCNNVIEYIENNKNKRI